MKLFDTLVGWFKHCMVDTLVVGGTDRDPTWVITCQEICKSFTTSLFGSSPGWLQLVPGARADSITHLAVAWVGWSMYIYIYTIANPTCHCSLLVLYHKKPGVLTLATKHDALSEVHQQGFLTVAAGISTNDSQGHCKIKPPQKHLRYVFPRPWVTRALTASLTSHLLRLLDVSFWSHTGWVHKWRVPKASDQPVSFCKQEKTRKPSFVNSHFWRLPWYFCFFLCKPVGWFEGHSYEIAIWLKSKCFQQSKCKLLTNLADATRSSAAVHAPNCQLPSMTFLPGRAFKTNNDADFMGERRTPFFDVLAPLNSQGLWVLPKNSQGQYSESGYQRNPNLYPY